MAVTPGSTVTHVTDADFDDRVLASEVPVLVDFWAAWCGPCRRVAPVLDDLAASEPRVRVAKVDVDAAPATAARFGVLSIPTLALFVDGVEQVRLVGAADRPTILRHIEPHLSAPVG